MAPQTIEKIVNKNVLYTKKKLNLEQVYNNICQNIVVVRLILNNLRKNSLSMFNLKTNSLIIH